ncbi:hypothetical protein, partial [Acinetobacter ursingii]|uniref:hypothetical protein n=1 Tax=Acinetobacter ursingii TaxID=108980 RepID=UPI00300B6C13
NQIHQDPTNTLFFNKFLSASPPMSAHSTALSNQRNTFFNSFHSIAYVLIIFDEFDYFLSKQG